MEEKRNLYNCAEAETVRIEGADKTRSGGGIKRGAISESFFATFLCINKKKRSKKLM